MSILAPQVPLFSAYWCDGMTVRESSKYNDVSAAWKLFNGTAVDPTDSWASVSGSFVGGVGDEFVEIDFGVERSVSAISIMPRLSTDWLSRFPKDFQLIADGVVVENITGLAPDAQQAAKEVPLSAPFRCKVLRMRITGIQDTASTYVVFGELNITFDDVPAGHVAIPAGLQVAYADSGRVQLSEELASLQAIDLSSAADGTRHVYADIAEDGNFFGFGATAVVPEVGAERADALADIFNPAEVIMYNVAGSPTCRVYIGTAVKSGGAITAVNGYALGDRVRLPATGTILDNPFGGWHVQATQGTALLSATPAAISGVTVNTTPVVVRR
jgi:hypothetical protein